MKRRTKKQGWKSSRAYRAGERVRVRGEIRQVVQASKRRKKSKKRYSAEQWAIGRALALSVDQSLERDWVWMESVSELQKQLRAEGYELVKLKRRK